jgi:hypothetical protein
MKQELSPELSEEARQLKQKAEAASPNGAGG